MKINAYAAKKAKSQLEKWQYEPKDLSKNDVEVKITHCGICHSDIHLIDNDWQMSEYPLVPGHEIIGEVTKKGSAVSHLNTGDRVGIGWQRSACLQCEQCLKGNENLCYMTQATCMGNHGGFADYIRTDSNFAFKIPEKLTSENAAPLLCGGITVYSPLRLWATPQMRIGVIGIGGLGHLALRYANAYGCEVTAFSTRAEKENEAKNFGAHNFIVSKNEDEFKKNKSSLDFILSTVTADLNWSQYISLLKPEGRLVIVGASPGPLKITPFELLMQRKSVSGSPIGGRNLINEMLKFSARHNISAKTEAVPMVEVNSALDRVRNSQARYRMVLKNK